MSGAYAANLLGLSEQVPARMVIHTDGVPRRVSLGKLTLTFRRAAPRNLVGAGRPAGLVIQALRHLRKDGLDEARLSPSIGIIQATVNGSVICGLSSGGGVQGDEERRTERVARLQLHLDSQPIF